MTTKVTSKVKAVVAEAVSLGEFVLSELSSPYAAARAVTLGYIKATKKIRKTGSRGRPATVYTVTAKGKKLV